MAKKTKSKGASLRPGDMSEGGGLPEGKQTVKKAYFGMFDYGGTRDEVPAIIMDLEDGDGGEAQQCWSVGKASDWAPSDDGTCLEPESERMEGRSINISSNGGRVLSSLVDHGFDEDKLGSGDITVLNGLVAEFTSTKIERKGLSDSNVLLITKIYSLPGESEKESGKLGKKKGKGKAKKKESNETEVMEAAEEVIVGLLEEEEDGIPIKKVVTEVNAEMEDDDDYDEHRDDILELVGDVDFLKDDERPWGVKGKKLVEN